MPIIRDPAHPGRPCRVCTSPHRSQIELALVTRDARIADISSEEKISQAAIRRHRITHMALEIDDARDFGLAPGDVLARLVAILDRLEDVADEAESRGRIADVTRALEGQRRVLAHLLDAGIRSTPDALNIAAANAILKALGRMARKNIDAGEMVAAELDRWDERGLAQELRDNMDTVRKKEIV